MPDQPDWADQPDPVPAGTRNETADERSDRNWVELLQELRVMQMGVQILTGFLLTLPFQSRFSELDTFQTITYLALVALAVLSTGLFITPVSLHRALFRRHLKTSLVTISDRFARIGVLVLAFVVAGTVLLVVDVVVGRGAAVTSAAITLVALLGLWFVLPRVVLRRG
ncbi:sodium:proton antiporter [Cellulosimicrobium terreum]|nr:sodium:proton antiporter [Cellulosimicrobium terreum]